MDVTEGVFSVEGILVVVVGIAVVVGGIVVALAVVANVGSGGQ